MRSKLLSGKGEPGCEDHGVTACLAIAVENMSGIVFRDARYSELPEVAHVMALAFWEDNLFGQLIHPHRNEFPDDVDLYWLRRARVNFWDYRWKLLVAVSKDESGREVIAGVAQWARLGDGGKELECWSLDPRE